MYNAECHTSRLVAVRSQRGQPLARLQCIISHCSHSQPRSRAPAARPAEQPLMLMQSPRRRHSGTRISPHLQPHRPPASACSQTAAPPFGGPSSTAAAARPACIVCACAVEQGYYVCTISAGASWCVVPYSDVRAFFGDSDARAVK